MISYYDATAADLKFAARYGGKWFPSWVDTAGVVGMYTSLALNASGTPHISYYDGTNGDLKYATGSIASFILYLPEMSDNYTWVAP
jgi:hypothetical protein